MTDNSHYRSLLEWKSLQEAISSCYECRKQWPDEVERPLISGEIPDPPPRINTLFIGVAPTAQHGRNAGKHFYSSSTDNLRKGLFTVLHEEFGLPLAGLDREEGTRRFLELCFFFVHAAKVRPHKETAPPPEVIEFCALQHLRAEIPLLNPKAICFLGTNASTAATAVFQQPFLPIIPVEGQIPEDTVHPGWQGKVVIAPQPVRSKRNKEGTASALRHLWNLEPFVA